MEEIVALCKRRGFVFPSSEIYGGVGSTYDYGHYGVLLKNNVKAEWWRAMLQERDDIVALDSAIIQHPQGLGGLGPPRGLHRPAGPVPRQVQEALARGPPARGGRGRGRRPRARSCAARECGGELSEPRQFNLMFETHVGPVAGEGSEVYLRPETAQGIFINFKNVLGFARKKPPFGIAQIGKSFRNEITPGNFIFRTREFEQMEMEFFVPPADAEQWYRTWIEERERWYTELGIRPEYLRVRPHDADELSHYSSGTSDVEYLFPIGWSELEGIANRGDFDLTQHAKFSGEKLEYFDQQTKERYVPHVIEPAAGADRATLAFLVDAYEVEEVEEPPAHGAAPPPAPGPGQGRRPAARLQGGDAGEGPRDLQGDPPARDPRPSSTRAARSASATAARTRSAPPGGSPSTTRRWRTTPSPCATATRSSSPGSRSRASPTSSPRRLDPALARARSWARPRREGRAIQGDQGDDRPPGRRGHSPTCADGENDHEFSPRISRSRRLTDGPSGSAPSTPARRQGRRRQDQARVRTDRVRGRAIHGRG